jgi:putative hydrolase of the HAD superfamily
MDLHQVWFRVGPRRKSPVIEGVLFDLFETLVTESNTSMRRASSLASELSVNEDAYRRHWRSRRPDVVLGRSTFRETLAQITRALGGTPDERLLDDLRSERMSDKAAVMRDVEPEVLAAVEALRGRGLKLALVSNSFAEDVAGWDRSPLRPFFDVTLFSCGIGLAKPDSRIYLLACRDLAIAPAHTLFIGDGADDELSGACTAGLGACRALWFLSRWPHATLPPSEPGLRHPTDVVHAAMPVIPA